MTKNRMTRAQRDDEPTQYEFEACSFSTSHNEADILGRGSYGVVRRCKHNRLGSVAVKCMTFSGSSQTLFKHVKEAKSRVKLLVSLQHTNIIQVYGVTSWSYGYVGMILEEVKCGDLRNLMIERQDITEIPWELRFRIILQIAMALRYLHCHDSKKAYIHLDVKPENVLLTMDLTAKLADFGAMDLAQATGATTATDIPKSKQWTVYYSAPERLNDKEIKATCAMDAYSFSMVCYEIITRRIVFRDSKSPWDILRDLIAGQGQKPNLRHVHEVESNLKTPDNSQSLEIFKSLKNIMESCWCHNSKHRLTMVEVCSCLTEFARSDNPYQNEIKEIAKSLASKLLHTSEEAGQKVPLSHHFPPFGCIHQIEVAPDADNHEASSSFQGNEASSSVSKLIRCVRPPSGVAPGADNQEANLFQSNEASSSSLSNQKDDQAAFPIHFEIKGKQKGHEEKDKQIQEYGESNEKLTKLVDKKVKLQAELDMVSDEKDARRMTEETEQLKLVSSRSNSASMDKWQTQRRQKVDQKKVLELQLNLQAEILEKQKTLEMLNKMTAHSLELERKGQESNKQLERLSEVKKKEEQLKKVSPDRYDRSMFDWYQYELLSLLSGGSSTTDDGLFVDTSDYPYMDKPTEISSSSGIMETKKLPTAHRYVVKTFPSPVKCNHCGSLMVGLLRQGASCEVCSFSCHVSCAQKAPAVCPIPPDQAKRAVGFDVHRGIGTAYEGYVRIPKPMGVKKGWMKQWAVVCDFKLFLYDVGEGGRSPRQASVIASQVIDMRDEYFQVSSVTEHDVIHANKKDIPCIFRVVASCMRRPILRTQVLLLADSESVKNKWICALSELHRMLKKHQPAHESIFDPIEAYDSQLPMIKSTLSCAILDANRLALGTEDGLYILELRNYEIVRVGDTKKVQAIEVLHKERLLVVISGWNRHIRLHSFAMLDVGEGEAVKIEEARGCTLLASGAIRQESSTCLCVAIKKQVLLYEMNNTKSRHKRIKDVSLPSAAQWMSVVNERLCVGYVSGFALFSIHGEASPISLLYYDDTSLSFLFQSATDALCAVSISNKECLLCFSVCGVYVGWDGRRSRQQELMWPATPISITYDSPYLLVFSENAIDVFEPAWMDWVQTIPLKKVRPLSGTGAISLSTSIEPPKLVYLKNNRSDDGDDLILPEQLNVGRRQLMRKNKRRSMFKVPPDEHRSNLRNELMKNPDRRRELISAPHNYNHVVHMGPGDGIQALRDLFVASSELASRKFISPLSNFNHVYHLGSDQPLREVTDSQSFSKTELQRDSRASSSNSHKARTSHVKPHLDSGPHVYPTTSSLHRRHKSNPTDYDEYVSESWRSTTSNKSF